MEQHCPALGVLYVPIAVSLHLVCNIQVKFDDFKTDPTHAYALVMEGGDQCLQVCCAWVSGSWFWREGA